MGLFWDILGIGSTVKHEKAPFSTQEEVLIKFGQATDVNGNVVGMCEPMTNVYVKELLEGRDPSHLLDDDHRFFKQSTHIENKQLDDRSSGKKDVEHSALNDSGVFHQDLIIDKADLTGKVVGDMLENSRHLLFVYPTHTPPGERQAYHESYLGRNGDDLQHGCRFFDANVRGGERKGPCDDVVREFINVTSQQYAKGNIPFSIGATTIR